MEVLDDTALTSEEEKLYEQLLLQVNIYIYCKFTISPQ